MIRECRIPDPKRDPTISTDGLEPGLSTPCRTSVVPRSDAFPAGIRRTAVGLRRDCGKARCDVSPLSDRGETGPGALGNMRGPTAVKMTQIRKMTRPPLVTTRPAWPAASTDRPARGVFPQSFLGCVRALHSRMPDHGGIGASRSCIAADAINAGASSLAPARRSDRLEHRLAARHVTDAGAFLLLKHFHDARFDEHRVALRACDETCGRGCEFHADRLREGAFGIA